MKDILTNYFSEIVSGIGAFGSVLGAIVAWLQYRKAKLSAEDARSSELKLLSMIKKNEMSRDTQRIKGLVERLSKYVRRGQRLRGNAGLNIKEDISKVIEFRNDFSSNSRYAKEHSKELTAINKIATSIDFSDVEEEERISSVNSLIEELNEIAVSIDEKVAINE